MTTFRKIITLGNKKYQRFLLLLIVLTLLNSVIETAGISAIMPFLSIAINFSLIETNNHYSSIYYWFGFQSPVHFVLSFGVLLIVFYVIRGGLGLLFSYLLARFTYGFQRVIMQNLFVKYLSLDYLDFTGRNSSVLTKTIIMEGHFAGHVISDSLWLMSESFVTLFLYSLLVVLNWKITLLMTVVLVLKALFLTQFVSRRIKASGESRETALARLYELLNSTFGNFKLIKLQDQQYWPRHNFEQASIDYKKANITNTTLSSFPRAFLETSSLCAVISLMLYLVWKEHGVVTFILPMVSVFVFALYRLLPSINRIMTCYNSLIYNHKAVDIIHGDMFSASEMLGNDKVDFENSIHLQALHFAYPGREEVITGVDLTIHKGEKIAFIGESGVGKSTLVDLIVGLYFPRRGEIRADGELLGTNNIRNWRSKIGYVPQQVYLFDGTVADNVVFSREFNEIKLIESLRKANIYDFLKSIEGVHTKVGENGIQLSGGQKQRIAIARALYGNPDVLVFDEATSALDTNTEAEIMDEIYKISGNKTLIIVAHRLNTVERCDRIFRLENGKVGEVSLIKRDHTDMRRSL